MSNGSNRTIPNFSTAIVPRNFTFSTTCPTNEQAAILPASSSYGSVKWQTVPMSPGNVRHQYSDDLFDYPDMYMSVPMGTLYDHDFSMSHPTGVGMGKVIGGGHFKTWPLTNRHVFEAKDYTSGFFKKPDSISSNVYNYGFETQPAHMKTGFS